MKSNGALENDNLFIIILTCSYIQINKAFEKLFLIRTQGLFMLIHEVEPAPLDLQRVLGRRNLHLYINNYNLSYHHIGVIVVKQKDHQNWTANHVYQRISIIYFIKTIPMLQTVHKLGHIILP